jgi:hypothetical protein
LRTSASPDTIWPPGTDRLASSLMALVLTIFHVTMASAQELRLDVPQPEHELFQRLAGEWTFERQSVPEEGSERDPWPGNDLGRDAARREMGRLHVDPAHTGTLTLTAVACGANPMGASPEGRWTWRIPCGVHREGSGRYAGGPDPTSTVWALCSDGGQPLVLGPPCELRDRGLAEYGRTSAEYRDRPPESGACR